MSEESVSLFRRLAAANQAAYEPELAVELNNLAMRLDKVRQFDRSVAVIEEGVAIFRRLAAADPVHAPRLAGLLNTLSLQLARVGRLDERCRTRRERRRISHAGRRRPRLRI